MSEYPNDAPRTTSDGAPGAEPEPDEDSGYRARSRADDIPCPFLTTAYNNGALVPDDDGTLDAPRCARGYPP